MFYPRVLQTMKGNSMTRHVGSCPCGTVRFEVHGGFDRFYLCHCEYWRKDTGSAHAANLYSRSAELTWLVGRDAVTSFTLPDTRHEKSFCRSCGSALPVAQRTDLLVVPAGCPDADFSVWPTAHIFLASRAAWEAATADAPEFSGLPERVDIE